MADIDYRLRNQVQEVERLVIQIGQTVNQVGLDVGKVGQETEQARSDLAALRAEFLAFVRRNELDTNIQRSETKIGALQDQIQHDFGHYNAVRRSAVGVLQAFDIGIISEETIRTVGEQLMVQTPRYWLAPALVGLAAWAADDRELCEKAIQEAFRRSPSKASLLMALILRRQRRADASVRWLRHYLSTQDPAALGRDFAVILESIAHGAFGPTGVKLMRDTLDRWTDLLLTDDTVQLTQVHRWRAEIDLFAAAADPAAFPHLRTLSPQWPALEAALSRAQAHAPLLLKYRAMLSEEIPPAERLEDAIDDILDRLVREYDNEELPLRRELAYHKAVVDSGGDLDVSRRTIDAQHAYEKTLDYLTIQSESALNPAAIGVSRTTQRLAVAACHEWFQRAHAAFTRDYRLLPPPQVDAVFGTSHNVGAKTFSLPQWTGNLAEPLDRLEHDLAEHWDRHGRPFVDSFAFDIKPGLAGLIGTAVGVLILVGACTQSVVVGLAGAVVSAGIWAVVLHTKQQTAARQQAEARTYIERSKAESVRLLRAAAAELTDWSSRYAHADAQESAVRDMIGDLARAGQSGSPYERRPVITEEQR
ncbi:hypothetical protein Cs7R123_62910 [Catellatospora sp. TT07R-123]|uniref:hypothetical protein n=1 Tax=Catellatospora sp. TT07R-123 TaxID=2733863 RepID=UPI001B1CBB0B|nr:hypothetical protein [Catellatospora sp. TT07R-123]GHJ48949.1 hypothetical protein Cs7R123_62910 [Catellatospora sp. TT07R-123]